MVVINTGGETENALVQKLKKKKPAMSRPITAPIEDEDTNLPLNQIIKFEGKEISKEKIRNAFEAIKSKSIENTNNLDQNKKAENIPTAKKKTEKPENQYNVLDTKSLNRKNIILKGLEIGFKLSENPKADGTPPKNRKHSENLVRKYEKIIEEEAKLNNIDPTLIKSIVYLETSQGYYDKIFDYTNDTIDKLQKSIRPMNVNYKYWKDLGYSKEDLKKPRTNIKAGIKILSGITRNINKDKIDYVGTLYNNLDAEKTSDYGAQLKKIYEEKPWIEN